MLVASIILALTYVGVAFTRLPRFNIDRPAAAMTGAVLMVLLGVITFGEAVAAIDFNTIGLLLGMMLLVAVLQRAGFFTLAATRFMYLASSPMRLLVVVVVATAVFSAFLVNDVVVLLFTPVLVQVCRMMRLNPIPYLIAEAMASNIGSTATIVGNPQNMLIGVVSGISFGRFLAYLAPVAVISSVILVAVVVLFYKRDIIGRLEKAGNTVGNPVAREAETKVIVTPANTSMLTRVIPILLFVVAGFFASTRLGLSIPMVALAGGAAAVLLSGVKPSEVIRGVDWVLLVFFAGLFVVVGGAKQAGVLDFFLERVDISPGLGGIFSIHIVSTVVSQIVSNVPFTLLAIPLIQKAPSDTLWVSLAAGSTLGGNATILGAVANIIVMESAYREGVLVRWIDFTKVGLVVTVFTLAVSVGILYLEYQTGLLR